MSETLPTPDLLDLATALVAIPSVSRSEKAMADAVEAAVRVCPWLEVDRIGDNVVARTSLGRSKRLMLAGHPGRSISLLSRRTGPSTAQNGRREHEDRSPG